MTTTSLFDLAGVGKAPKEEKPKVPNTTKGVVEVAPAPKQKQSIFEFAKTAKGTVKLTNDDVLNNPAKMKIVRDYMIARKGDFYKKAPIEDVFDDYIDHMRWMNTNEISTIGEAISVFDLEDKDKPLYADAYNLYDEMGSAWQAGGLAEVGDATANYAGAILTSPSSYVGGILGRAFAKPVTTGITKLTGKKLVQEGVKTAVKETAEQGVTTTAKKAAITSAAKAVEKQVAKKSGVIAARKSRTELVTAAIIATATDGLMSAGQENLRQNVLVNVGAQEEVDRTAVALSTAFGLIGGGFSYFPEAMRGTVKLTDADAKMTLAKKLRAKEAKKKVGVEIESSIKQLVTDWEALAKQGQAQDANKFLRDKALNWFFDVDNEKSFIRILQRLGADLGSDEKTFSHKVVEYARGLAPQSRAAITKTLKPLGINFGEMIEIFAGSLREGGESLSLASQAKRFYEDFGNVAVKKQQAVLNTLAAEDAVAAVVKEAPSPQVLRYTASVWKRLLVSHISTTMLNLKGWGVATSARTMSEILHGGVLGSVGIAQKLMGSSAADKTLARSSAMFKSNLLLARSLVDPFTAAQGFMDLLDLAPKKFKSRALSSFYQGGVGDEGPELFNINPSGWFVKNLEKGVDVAADIAFVRTQDIYTKSITGLKALDQATRTQTGRGVEDLLAKGETHLIPEEAWEKATKALLEDTFSADYTKGGSGWNMVAKAIEQVSNLPGIGFVFPFGRFVNNTVGFAFQYSPLAFLPFTKYQKGADLEERLAKAMVGTAALAMVYQREEEKQKQGLQWNEERTSTGEIKNVGNIFPLSLYNLTGRIFVDVLNGQGLPPALIDELIKQVGPLGILNEATSSNPLVDMVRELAKVAENPEGIEFMQVANYVGSLALGAAASVGAGFTRPLDPLNDIVGVATDFAGATNNANLDRKMAEGSDKVIQNFTRYTNTFFNLMLGEDKTGEGKIYGSPKNSATEDKALKDPNPVSRLFGQPIQPRQDSIDILLGKLDMAPYRMDSLTTGIPEYDDFVNNTIFPILERKAEAMLNSEFFNFRPLSVQRVRVSEMLSDARKEILEGLEEGYILDAEAYAAKARRDFTSLPQAYRAEAKKALGITTKDRELTVAEVEQLKLWIEINQELDDYVSKNQ